MYEEAGEIMLALHDRDEAELVDGLGDLLYVAAGMWVAVVGLGDMPQMVELKQYDLELWSPNFEQTLHTHVDKVVKYTCGIENEGWFGQPIYHAVYALSALGYDPKGVFDEIHSSNMTKTPTKGDIRVRVKGTDYRAPDVTRFLRGK